MKQQPGQLKVCRTCKKSSPDVRWRYGTAFVPNTYRGPFQCYSCYKLMCKARHYGITTEELSLLHDVSVCQICEQSPAVCIDHDHETGAVRGALCNLCNRGIGLLKDSPEVLRRAAEYLEA